MNLNGGGGGSEPNPMGGLTLEVATCFIDLIMKLKSGFFWAKALFSWSDVLSSCFIILIETKVTNLLEWVYL